MVEQLVSSTIRILYARSGPEEPEPLIAVVATEEEARATEAEIVNREPETRVVWETHEVFEQIGDTVHVVALAAGGDTSQEAADPIAASVHAQRSDAVHDLAMRRGDADHDHYIVRSLPVGWRRAGLPFVERR
ncbi:hypothetical protein [Arthrobacter roseus]|uniref:hypothetical protein n=1 Tax=Arthrobacter roseus TaxID=136274 RepID=UPI001962B09B|nr:hypothetical protein [Arthrobacter roseus]MBM7849425.1 hypothetical protein [Arthrobacter roseus]